MVLFFPFFFFLINVLFSQFLMNQNPQGQTARELWAKAKIMERKWLLKHSQGTLHWLLSFTTLTKEQRLVPAHYRTASQEPLLKNPLVLI